MHPREVNAEHGRCSVLTDIDLDMHDDVERFLVWEASSGQFSIARANIGRSKTRASSSDPVVAIRYVHHLLFS